MVDRRLLVLVSGVVMIETLFFAALIPLLPQLTHEFGLSKAGAGVLSGAYPAGGTVGALLGAWLSTRLGVRPTTVLGLLVLVVCCVGFGVAGDVRTLDTLRAVQGAGGAVAWTGGLAWLVSEAQAERRGELLGIAMGAAVVGALLGPLVGAAARLTSRPLAFTVVALPGLALALWAARMPAPARVGKPPLVMLLHSFRARAVGAGFWLVALPSLLFGALTVLGPLSLDRVGLGALGIATFWLVSAAIGAAQSPVLGLWSDRRTRLEPVRVALVASIAVSLAIPLARGEWMLVALVLVASVVYNAFWVPGGALLTEAAEAHGLEAGFSFALFNLAWAPAGAFGAAAGGALASALGDGASYLVLAAVCVGTLLVLTPQRVAIGQPALAVARDQAGGLGRDA